MTALVADSVIDRLNINGTLLTAVDDAVRKVAQMCDTKLRCVGASAIPTSTTGVVTGMIGVHGKVSGFVTVNLCERLAIRAVEGLLQESYCKINSQVIDACGEITNITAGGIKSALAPTPWGFAQMTVPSVIVGQNFTIAYSRSMEFITVAYEHDDPDAIRVEERTLQVTLSLLPL